MSAVATHRHDPEPAIDRIDQLARRVFTGDILLPKFQRDFVWKHARVVALLDSIAKGYPIGSILLWRTKQELKSERRLADLDVAQTPADYPYNYLLDGQQRLSTLCGALFWNGKDAKSLWNLAYDLRTSTFEHLTTLEEPPLHQIRVNKLVDASAYFGQVARLELLTSPDKDELKTRAKELFNWFKDYKIAVVTLGDMSIGDVAPIFERINSQGVPLTRVELLRAATWSKEFDLADALEDIGAELSERGFGDLDQKAILRNLSASQGGGFTIGQIELLRNSTPQKQQQAAATIKAAYQRAVDFLVGDLGIVGSAALPYTHQVTVLAEAFRLLPSVPAPSALDALRRWFWRTSLGSYFGGWNTGQMASDLKAVRAFAEGAQAELPVDAKRHEQTVWFSRPFRANAALSKTFALLLAKHHPRDLLTGQPIDTRLSLSWTNQKEFHHAFPKKRLKLMNVSAERANAFANIIYLTSASNKSISASSPKEYLASARARLGSEFDAVIASNLISPAALEAAERDDYDAFLLARSEVIEAAAQKFAAWSPSVATIPIEDDIERDEDDVTGS